MSRINNPHNKRMSITENPYTIYLVDYSGIIKNGPHLQKGK